MTPTKHASTWVVAQPSPSAIRIVDGETGLSIADIVTPCTLSAAKSVGEAKAFALLIAAAPDLEDLAESLGRVDAVAKRSGNDGRVFIDYRDWEALMAQQRAALAKARGEG